MTNTSGARHIVSATSLTTGEHLTMCGDRLPSYAAGVAAGCPVGNYLTAEGTRDAYARRGVTCEPCMDAHARRVLS